MNTSPLEKELLTSTRAFRSSALAILCSKSSYILIPCALRHLVPVHPSSFSYSRRGVDACDNVTSTHNLVALLGPNTHLSYREKTK